MTLFDQYQRYNNAALAINCIRTDGQTFRILEVGANEHKNLETFLPQDQIMYLDIQLPDHLMDDPQYILGDATAMEFKDDEYDVVIALDVFEHIPPDRRKQFIDELQRVSKEFFLITAPFDSKQVVNSETMANAVYKGIFGEDFIWLKEHRDNGLPKLDELENYLSSQTDTFYKIVGHGNLDIWEKMIKIHFFAACHQQLGLYRDELDHYYNNHIFEWDYCKHSYRKIVIASKKNNLDIIDSIFFEKKMPVELLEGLNKREQDFYHLVSLLRVGSAIHANLVEDELKVYINTGEDYNENDTIVYELIGQEESKEYHFDLQEYESIVSIRVDPSNYSGIYKIQDIRLVNSEHEYLPYTLQGNFDIEVDDIYVFDKDDPYIIFNLHEPAKVRQLSLTVCSGTRDLAAKVNQIQYDNSAALREDLEKLQQEHAERMMELQQKLDDSEQTLHDHKKESSEKIKDCNNEKLALVQELNAVYNSRKWKYLLLVSKFFGKR
ncbi:class I SAM-dependent methyltransferase [Paenibacillus wenxiniae]|uniref:Class I SAM-dependent methyltransferase n=1 Tax=Paenibacillus wenxiniae TaxID=1636843 RepID=A0ABW4RHJ6_9BACL